MSDIVAGIPSLTLDGNIIDSDGILSKVFEYYLASDYSQSNFFINKVRSLKKVMGEEKDPSKVSYSIKEDLTELYKGYFDDVVITINIDETTYPSTVLYQINVVAYKGNSTYELSQVVDSSLANTTAYNDALAALINKYTI